MSSPKWTSTSSTFPLPTDISPTSAAVTTLATASILYLYHLHRTLPPKPTTGPTRPKLVLDALAAKQPIYYLGIGSNLSRKKLESRSMNGEKIEIISMEPCVVHDYRLAFNMRALPPVEPAMGSVEPLPSFYEKQKNGSKNGNESGSNGNISGDKADCDGGEERKLMRRMDSKALKPYERQECHGALIQLTSDNYELVYKSEGGGMGARQGYEEIIVECEPYDPSHPPVKAVAFRTREHIRLPQDPCPSKRYMNIIREGAAELGLKECYQQWLNEHPVQDPSRLLKKLAINSAMFTFPLAIGLKFTLVSEIQSLLLYRMYVLPTEPKWKQILGEVAAGAILIPTACLGIVFRGLLEVTGLMPPLFKKWILSLE